MGSRPDIGACESPLGTPTAVHIEDLTIPNGFALRQNYLNPFNPGTTIRSQLPKSSIVRLSVYDVLGREVSVLVDERKDPGNYEVQFDASNLSSGVHLYRLQVRGSDSASSRDFRNGAEVFVQSCKLMILR